MIVGVIFGILIAVFVMLAMRRDKQQKKIIDKLISKKGND